MPMPKLLILSHVFPFPRKAGQQQRVYYTIKALREFFHITFLGISEHAFAKDMQEKLSIACNDVIILSARYSQSQIGRVWHKVAGICYSAYTGLKFSNYVIGKLELNPSRLDPLFKSTHFDCALFEYWHAVDSTTVFHQRGIPAVLDTHDVLWQSYERDLNAKPILPTWYKRRAIAAYKQREEDAWNKFDALIAINKEEEKYIRSVIAPETPIFYAPMGVDLDHWSFSWQPANPPRVAYYGSLGNANRQRDALSCYESIMPQIWQTCPNTEFWIIGADPPPMICSLASDPRVKVTGYVERVQDILKTISIILCPWTGTYGFRSRLVEVMALGVPVVASPEATYGMDLDVGRGIFLEETLEGMGRVSIGLLTNAPTLREQSHLARVQVESKFGFDATYGRMARELYDFTLCNMQRTRKENR